MNKDKTTMYSGLLTLERLFIGSKSEGIYPVLTAEDGRMYRIHQKGQKHLALEFCVERLGSKVQVEGIANNLRGHWRIILEAGESSDFIKIINDGPSLRQSLGVSDNA